MKLVSHTNDLTQCGPNFCNSRANLYNAANMAGRKQNTKIMAMVKINNNFNFKKYLNQYRSVIGGPEKIGPQAACDREPRVGHTDI
jgi:hypothetical protein